ncbi:MAG: hypothetical protein SCK57_08665 [Bacillota bacterium]|nr:hypothetical protein [Bacillota bacterium]MDW7677720.1 hypothetical protein [Bacillota bacterium]
MFEIGVLVIILFLLLVYFTLCYQKQLRKRLSLADVMKGAGPFVGNLFLSTVIFLLLVAVIILVTIVAAW